MRIQVRLTTIILILIAFADFSAKAQQVPLLDQYYINPVVYNPAATGANGLFNSYLIRNQKFMGFDGGQVTHVFTADAALNDGKYGAGLNLTNDDVGIFSNTQALLSYSYRLKFSDKHNLRFGISAGVSDFRMDMSGIIADSSDPYLLNNNIKNTEFMANLGVYYTYNNLLLGITVPQLLNNSISESSGDKKSTYQLDRQFLVTGGCRFPINMVKNLSISPFLLLRYADNSPFQYDVNVIADLKDKGWFAVNYRDEFSLGLNLGVKILKNFTIGYSYDLGVKKAGRYASNNHEFLLGFSLPLSSDKKPDRILDNDSSILKTLLAEKYKKIDYLRKALEEMEKRDKQSDQDRDGVADDIDQCPNTPSYYIVDETGCPVDSDGDGIVDSEDLCPEIAGSFENKGCPEQKEEKIDMEDHLENIYFSFGNYTLTEYSRNKLAILIKILKKNQNYTLKMHGHTDDIGSDSSNIELAYKRLLTVKNYLVLNGIPDNQIIVVPHGESLPVVANTDNKSRANNRRVSFEIYNYQ
ncbi:type IX secretion system membrane protein PorP/SprF [Labilibaculum sp. A4]|uniref:PorP/SprF family type IX secretion system membrane protein n=1 Tax=Labilibaculum euxinus TaxID=2686357 RepID=UPI000F61B837|nr:PorP/SprF family type IX secretion system membrane protein [Labilibaculum euxinus]MDQ1771652.1 PorP/SprF family type IX secretion system membrane protein [Labilibaculum euxinus]MWN77359.1 type IX secretion system membrane protein PorP/SprF [Labilibaculum euxinus]